MCNEGYDVRVDGGVKDGDGSRGGDGTVVGRACMRFCATFMLRLASFTL